MGKQIDLKELTGQSAQEIASEIAAFAETAKVLSSNHPRLIESHAQQWVGLFDGKVEIFGSTLAAVMEQVKAKGYPAKSVNIRFIDKDERIFVL